MGKIGLKLIKDFAEQESISWGAVQELRKKFEKNLNLEIYSNPMPSERAVKILRDILGILEELEVDLGEVEPGHGIGHMARDYAHALILSKKGEGCFIAGVLHDFLGCILVDRYDDWKKAVRHAEAGALFLSFIGKSVGLPLDETVEIAYAISAHTHYLRPVAVKCDDGDNREILPYVDTTSAGEAIASVNFPRWVDRLDVSGPCFVGRHYLTRAEEHKDFSAAHGFHFKKFEAYMIPSLRSREEIAAAGEGQTMLEHLKMFHDSQNSESVYGRFDPPAMVELRESYRKRMARIIESVASAPDIIGASDDVLREWTKFLTRNIEPSAAGRVAAEKLEKMFMSLPEDTRRAWINGFRVTMAEYDAWSKETLALLEDFPEDDLILPIIGDIRDIIRRQ